LLLCGLSSSGTDERVMEQSAKTLTAALGRVINSIVVGHQTGENFLPIYVQNTRKLSTKPVC